mmetsp:Transcript_97698/g.209650  ORF Transcript_97698/g.209650 Transcript_97698/m.209650 type:complete len:272 (+) Transcript_97698:77-892(+)
MEASQRWAQELGDVLRDAQPSWSLQDLASVMDKLAKAGIESPGALADALRGQINERLRRKGVKTFKAETIRRLQGSLATHHPQLVDLAEEGQNQGSAPELKNLVEAGAPGFALDDALICEVKKCSFSSFYLYKSPLQRSSTNPNKLLLHQIVQLFGDSGVLQLEFFVTGVRYQRKAAAEVFRGGAELVSQATLPPPSDRSGGEQIAEVLKTWLSRSHTEEGGFAGPNCIDFASEVVKAAGGLSSDLMQHFITAQSELKKKPRRPNEQLVSA